MKQSLIVLVRDITLRTEHTFRVTLPYIWDDVIWLYSSLGHGAYLTRAIQAVIDDNGLKLPSVLAQAA